MLQALGLPVLPVLLLFIVRVRWRRHRSFQQHRSLAPLLAFDLNHPLRCHRCPGALQPLDAHASRQARRRGAPQGQPPPAPGGGAREGIVTALWQELEAGPQPGGALSPGCRNHHRRPMVSSRRGSYRRVCSCLSTGTRKLRSSGGCWTPWRSGCGPSDRTWRSWTRSLSHWGFRLPCIVLYYSLIWGVIIVFLGGGGGRKLLPNWFL